MHILHVLRLFLLLKLSSCVDRRNAGGEGQNGSAIALAILYSCKLTRTSPPSAPHQQTAQEMAHAVQTRPMLQQRALSVQCFASNAVAPKPASLARKLQKFGAAVLVTTGSSASLSRRSKQLEACQGAL